jgi:DNA-binding GntR family transcriptional regulator
MVRRFAKRRSGPADFGAGWFKYCEQFVLTILARYTIIVNNFRRQSNLSFSLMAMLRLKPDRAAQDLKAPRASTLRDPKPAGEPLDVDRVYGEIFDAAMDRRLLPGTKLTESALCTAFDCSRGTVRAALARLAHDKLVAIEPNRGAYVWQAESKEVHDVFAMRRALECIVIDMLVALDDVADRLAPLRGMVEREQRAFEQGDRISWLRLSNAFHVELARVLDNQVLTDMLAGLCARTTLIIALGDTTEGSACSYLEHRDILDCIARRDATGARAAMDHHLKDCEQRMDTTPGPGADPWAAFQRHTLTPSI